MRSSVNATVTATAVAPKSALSSATATVVAATVSATATSSTSSNSSTSSSSSANSAAMAAAQQSGGSFGSFSYIGSLGLKSLQMEPQRLASESNKINEELEALVLDNYRVFVDNLACSVQLRNEDKLITASSDGIRSDLNNMSAMCLSYREKVYNLVSAHKRNRKTLEYHMQLVELLEVPQLVDACSRNGFYDEALELANFISSLARRHVLATESRTSMSPREASSSSNVIQSIVDEVFDTLIKLRIQLLHILTDNLSLSKGIQITSTLRKLDSLLIDRRLSLASESNSNDSNNDSISDKSSTNTDAEKAAKRSGLIRSAEMSLQMDFLEARTIWMDRLTEKTMFDSLNAHINSDINATNAVGPYGRAIEILEINRSAWFSVITQFKALFSEDQVLHDQNSGLITSSDALTIWTNIQVNRLLNTLSGLLYQIEEGASLRSVMEQALGFAARMSQVGCDFTTLLIALFENIICEKVYSEWTRATKQFKSLIINEKMTFDSEESKEQIVPLYFSTEDQSPSISNATSGGASSDLSSSKTSRKIGEISAPTNAANFPPLAYLLNSFLTSINFLRDCPLKAVTAVLYSRLAAIIDDVTVFIADNSAGIKSRGAKYLSGRHKSSGKAQNTVSSSSTASSDIDGLASMYSKCYLQDVLPHIVLTLESIFPAKARQHNLSMPFKVNTVDDILGLCSDRLSDILSSAWAIMGDRGLIEKPSATITNSSASIKASTSTSTDTTTTATSNATTIAIVDSPTSISASVDPSPSGSLDCNKSE